MAPKAAKPSAASKPKASVGAKTSKASPSTKKPAAGKGKVVAGKGKASPSKKAAAPKWSPEETAAGTKIQAQIRGYLARKHFKEQKERDQKMKEEMEQLRQQAYLAEVEYSRKQEAKRRKKQAEEAAKKKKTAKLKKDMLESAFDGEVDDLKKFMSEAEDIMDDVVDVADGHGNTLLSEAAAGGAADVVKLLLGFGADPNSQGEFKRTPLWRAAFLGKTECIGPLLASGADPRIGNEQGEIPLHVGNPAVKEILEAWDVSQTDSLVAKFESMKLEKEAARKAKQQADIKEAENELTTATELHEKSQKDLRKARMELERLLYEHDTLVEEGKPQSFVDVAVQAIKDQEAKLEAVTKVASEMAEKLQNARLSVREKASAAASEEDEELPGLLIQLKELDDVLIKDVGDRVRNSGKWPAVIDTSSQASVFLRYMDTNYVNVLNINQVEPNKLRRSLLGSIRYGKPCVIDVMDVSMWDELVKMFDAVEPGLFSRLLDKSLLQNEAYLSLVRKADGEEYEANQFQEVRVKNFKLVFLTSARQPETQVIDAFYVIRIKVQDK